MALPCRWVRFYSDVAQPEFPGVYIKDEGLNPTGSFKARGLSAAVTMAKAYGLKKLAIPSAGNAASALAAYAAAAGLEAHIFMPPGCALCQSGGVRKLRRTGDAGRRSHQRLCPPGAERKDKEGWFDVSTLKEPFRLKAKRPWGTR